MASERTVYLFDVDNTLVDNDRVQADMVQPSGARNRSGAQSELLGTVRGATHATRICRLSRRVAALSDRFSRATSISWRFPTI